MSEFDQLMAAGFRAARDVIGVNITHNGVTRKTISTPIRNQLEIQEAGYMPQVDTVVDLLQSDFDDLGIDDRSEPVVSGVTLRVLEFIIDEPTGIVMLGCKHGR